MENEIAAESQYLNDCHDGLAAGGCAKQLLPIRDALDLLSGKWKLPIIVALLWNKRRFKEMQHEVTGITAKMLSHELKQMEQNLLVKRTASESKPYTVEYELTEYGRTLQKVIDELAIWGREHRKKIFSGQ